MKVRREEGFIYEQDYINGTVRRRTEIEEIWQPCIGAEGGNSPVFNSAVEVNNNSVDNTLTETWSEL